jgi:hypothetical protein
VAQQKHRTLLGPVCSAVLFQAAATSRKQHREVLRRFVKPEVEKSSCLVANSIRRKPLEEVLNKGISVSHFWQPRGRALGILTLAESATGCKGISACATEKEIGDTF